MGKVIRVVCGIKSCGKIFSDGLEQNCKLKLFLVVVVVTGQPENLNKKWSTIVIFSGSY